MSTLLGRPYVPHKAALLQPEASLGGRRCRLTWVPAGLCLWHVFVPGETGQVAYLKETQGSTCPLGILSPYGEEASPHPTHPWKSLAAAPGPLGPTIGLNLGTAGASGTLRLAPQGSSSLACSCSAR